MGTIPTEIAKGELNDLIAYLRALAKGSDFYSKVKLMFVGEGKTFLLLHRRIQIYLPHTANVGKSSLLSSFVNISKKKNKKESLAPPEPNVATDGIDIADTAWEKCSRSLSY